MKAGTKEISRIIYDAIIEEPYLNRDVIINKIESLIKAFRMDINTMNYMKALTEKDTARLIRANELQNLEKSFWTDKVRTLCSNDEMELMFKELDLQREKWGAL